MPFFLLLLALFLTLPAGLHAETPGRVVAGNARFTVITPNLIRLEYAPDGKFVDLPSWFAIERKTRDPGSHITAQEGGVEIDTGAIRLSYCDNGLPFSPDNLSAKIKKGGDTVLWKPGLTSTQNLGGTIRTLDGVTGPVPLGEGLLSRDGWYLLDDSQTALFVGDWIESRPKNGGLDWYLFGYGHDYRAAFHSLTAVGGPVPLPRKYSLGSWYSRYWPYSSDEFKKIVEEYGQHGFPLDMIVMDMDWHLNKVDLPHVNSSHEPRDNAPRINTWTGYTWDRALIPDPPALLKWFHEQGLHVTLNDHPAAGLQPHEEMYVDFMKAMEKDPASGETIPFDAGDKAYLDQFYRYSHLPREQEGVDFWWLDWQQYPNTLSLPELTNLQVLNFYNYTRSARDGQRGESFSRWAGWGDHRYPIQFSGDADTGWKMLAFEIPFTSTGGNVGAFFWSHDIGGHMGGRNEESYTRACQFGAFSAALRSHSTRNASLDRRPWTYPDWAEASMRRSFRLRAEMMPYFYTSIWQATQSSVPFLRPLYIEYPELEAAYRNAQEYLFGDNLLVAPITRPGVGPNRVASQMVWLPEGEWTDFFTGESFHGPTSAISAHPIDSFPLYIRGGVPLPMQAFTPRPGTAPLTDLVLRCYSGPEGKSGSSILYEDDGVTTGYEHGAYATTQLTYTRRGDEITVTVAPTEGSFPGQPASRRCVVELPGTAKLTSCSLAEARTTYDEAQLMNRIELPEESVREGWTLVVHATGIEPDQLAQRATAQRLQDLLGEPYEVWKAKKVALASDLEPAFAAAQGFALVEQSLHPYLLGNKSELLYLHNHQDTPEPVSIAVGSATATTGSLRSGDPVLGARSESNGLPLATTIPVTVTPQGPAGQGVVLHASLQTHLALADDLALAAKPEASSGEPGPVIDGVVGGYPEDQRKEWVTNGKKEGAWIQLGWSQPVEANALYLYDRPNSDDHVLAGTLEFDDGTKLKIEALPNDAMAPLKVTFPLKTLHWVKFTVTGVSPKTQNIGLSEIAVVREK